MFMLSHVRPENLESNNQSLYLVFNNNIEAVFKFWTCKRKGLLRITKFIPCNKNYILSTNYGQTVNGQGYI